MQYGFNHVKNMGKDLYTFFEERFNDKLKSSKSRTEAFYRAIDDVGFDAYSSYTSFSARRVAKNKKKKKR